MVNVLELLPLLQGWNWIRFKDSTSIQASQEKTIYSSTESERGWIVSARVSTDVADVQLDIRYDPEESGQTIDINLNPQNLYNAGYTYASGWPYVAVYEPTQNEYAAEFVPTSPFAFNGQLIIKLVGGSSDANVNYDIQMVSITDFKTFVESLRHIIGISDVLSMLAQLQQPQQPQVPVKVPTFEPYQYRGFLP